MPKKVYLITGGAGFIGSAIARRLLQKNNRVIVLDNLLTGFRENVPSGAEFIYFDVSDKKHYDKLKKIKVDVVLHLAAQSSGEISFDNPVFDLDVNLRGTVLLIDWCVKNRVKRFVDASSMAVYGDNYRKAIKEDFIATPKSFYGINKLACEHYLRLYSAGGLKFTTFRMFNVYGPGQNIKNVRQGMASIYLYYLLNKKPILIKGSLERYRDFVYIDDIVDAWIKVIDKKNSYGKIYNLGSGQKTKVSRLVKELITSCGYKKYPISVKGKTPGDIFGSLSDITLIKKDIGWKPKVSLKEGIKKMVEFYKKA